MAVAAAAAAAGVASRFSAKRGTARISSVILMRFPMTPVDSMSTSFGSSRPSVSATVRADSSVSSMPFAPVAALAWPAFTSTALAVSLAATALFEKSTGAAATTFRVKHPAETAGSSATINAQSARVPDARRPAFHAAALNPAGAQTPPSITDHGPAGMRSAKGASLRKKRRVPVIARRVRFAARGDDDAETSSR
jgi:hypothetical protein